MTSPESLVSPEFAHKRLLRSLIWTRALSEPGELVYKGHDLFMHAIGCMMAENYRHMPRTLADETSLTLSGIVLMYRCLQGSMEVDAVKQAHEWASVPEEKTAVPIAQALVGQIENGRTDWECFKGTALEVRTLDDIARYDLPWNDGTFAAAAYSQTQLLSALLVEGGHRPNNGDYLDWARDNPQEALAVRPIQG